MLLVIRVLHFTWEDVTNYVGQREQFVDNYGTQNEAQNETHCAKVFKKFFYEDLMEIIVGETNTYSMENTSWKFHSLAFQDAGLEACH